jgi:hypothetical protein
MQAIYHIAVTRNADFEEEPQDGIQANRQNVGTS